MSIADIQFAVRRIFILGGQGDLHKIRRTLSGILDVGHIEAVQVDGRILGHGLVAGDLQDGDIVHRHDDDILVKVRSISRRDIRMAEIREGAPEIQPALSCAGTVVIRSGLKTQGVQGVLHVSHLTPQGDGICLITTGRNAVRSAQQQFAFGSGVGRLGVERVPEQRHRHRDMLVEAVGVGQGETVQSQFNVLVHAERRGIGDARRIVGGGRTQSDVRGHAVIGVVHLFVRVRRVVGGLVFPTAVGCLFTVDEKKVAGRITQAVVRDYPDFIRGAVSVTAGVHPQTVQDGLHLGAGSLNHEGVALLAGNMSVARGRISRSVGELRARNRIIPRVHHAHFHPQKILLPGGDGIQVRVRYADARHIHIAARGKHVHGTFGRLQFRLVVGRGAHGNQKDVIIGRIARIFVHTVADDEMKLVIVGT